MNFLDSRAGEENYEIPAQIGGELTAINLKIIRKGEGGSGVSISFESATYGSVNANFRMEKEGLEGLMSIGNKEASERIKAGEQVLRRAFAEEDLYLSRMDIVENIEIAHTDRDTEEISGMDAISTDSLYKTAKVFIGFIQDTAAA
jgi:hypothetical protein